MARSNVSRVVSTLVLGLAGALGAEAAELAGGGVRLEVDATLRLTALRAADKDLAVAPAPLLELCAVEAGAYAAPRVEGGDAAAGWTLRFEPARASANLSVRQEAEALRFACTVKGDPGPARGVLLRFSFPFDATGWRWHSDLQTSEEVTGTRTHANVRPLRAYADLPEWADQPDLRMGYSNRNFCTVLSGPAGLCLAVPIDRPCLFRTAYDGKAKRLEIVFDFALSPDTRIPQQAEFAFDLYACDPAWGFRAALARYYTLYPELFRVHIREQGQWMAFNRLSQIDNANEFGFGLQEGAPETEYDDQIGVLSTLYFTHAGMGANIPGYDPEKDPLPDHETQVAAVEQAFKSRTGREGMFHQVGLYTPAGALDVQKWRVYNHLIAQFNLDPELPYGEWTLERAVAQTAEIKAKRKADLDGFYYDGLSAGVNYRPDHFRTADAPCLWDPVAKKPFINNFFSSCEFARAAAERLRPRGQITMMNGAVGASFYVAPWLDVLGEETGLRISREDLNYIRATTYHKPFLTLLKGNYEQQIGHAEMELFMKRCLAYGIFPGFFDWPPSGMGPGGQYWNHPRYYERDRDLFRLYQPLCRAVAMAGWEPVTHARSADPAVYVERFGPGDDGVVWLTLLNEDRREHRTRLTVDAAALGLNPAAVRATDVLSGTPVTLVRAGGAITADVALPADGVLALQFATPAQAARWRSTQALATLASGIRMRAVDKDKPGRPVHWLPQGGTVTRTAAAGGVTLTADGTSSPSLSQWVMLFQSRPSEVTVRLQATARDLSGPQGTVGLRCRAAWLSPSFAYYEENAFDVPPGSYDARELTFKVASVHALRAIQVTAFMKPGARGSLTLSQLSLSDASRSEYAVDPAFAQWYEPVPAALRERLAAEGEALRATLTALGDASNEPQTARARLAEAFGACCSWRALVQAEKAENGCRRVLRDVETIERHLGFVTLAAYGLEPPRVDGPLSAAPGDVVALAFAAPQVAGVAVRARLDCPGAKVTPTATGGEITVPADSRPGDALAVTGTLELGEAGRAVTVSAQHTMQIVRPLELTLQSDGSDTATGGARLRAVLTNNRRRPVEVTLAVQPPAGWLAEVPPSIAVPPGSEVETAVLLRPGTALTAGTVDVGATATTAGGTVAARAAFFHIPAQANRLRNPGFEEGLAGWSPNEGKATVDTTVARSGKGSLRLANPAIAATGVSQSVALNQTTPAAILVRAAAKAQQVSGSPDKGYSLYVDIYHTDGTPLYGHTVNFQTGTADWQAGELYIEPVKPIRNVNVYLLLRGKSGTAWFDDVALMEDPRRRGNLAREATVTVDSRYSGYDAAPLNDGLIEVADLHWTRQAWASAENDNDHAVVLAFKEPRTVARAAVYWSLDAGIARTSEELQLQVPEGDGWKTVATLRPAAPEAVSELRSAPPVTATRFRLLQPSGKGSAGRRNLMWVREVELFAE